MSHSTNKHTSSRDAQRHSKPPAPYHLSAHAAAERRPARSGSTPVALVLPWHAAHSPAHSSPRHQIEPSASRTPTHGALALIEQPEVYPTPTPAAARRTILLVEDDPQLVGALRSTLELEGEPTWHIETTGDGYRALDLAANLQPRIVLLDVSLPGLDGIEVYHRLRANPATCAAHVLFLTAATSLDLHLRGVGDGILLRKPFDMGALVELVRALLAE